MTQMQEIGAGLRPPSSESDMEPGHIREAALGSIAVIGETPQERAARITRSIERDAQTRAARELDPRERFAMTVEATLTAAGCDEATATALKYAAGRERDPLTAEGERTPDQIARDYETGSRLISALEDMPWVSLRHAVGDLIEARAQYGLQKDGAEHEPWSAVLSKVQNRPPGLPLVGGVEDTRRLFGLHWDYVRSDEVGTVSERLGGHLVRRKENERRYAETGEELELDHDALKKAEDTFGLLGEGKADAVQLKEALVTMASFRPADIANYVRADSEADPLSEFTDRYHDTNRHLDEVQERFVSADGKLDERALLIHLGELADSEKPADTEKLDVLRTMPGVENIRDVLADQLFRKMTGGKSLHHIDLNGLGPEVRGQFNALAWHYMQTSKPRNLAEIGEQ